MLVGITDGHVFKRHEVPAGCRAVQVKRLTLHANSGKLLAIAVEPVPSERFFLSAFQPGEYRVKTFATRPRPPKDSPARGRGPRQRRL